MRALRAMGHGFGVIFNKHPFWTILACLVVFIITLALLAVGIDSIINAIHSKGAA